MKLSNVEIIDQGLKCLSDGLGAEGAELFIFTLFSEKFDYTKWRKSWVDQFDTLDKFNEFVEKSNPDALYGGNPDTIR